MNVKGIIFDMDGTLIDSMPAWENIGADYLKSKGITPPQNLNDKLKKLSFEQAAQYFIDQFGLSISASQILSEINAMIVYRYENTIPLKPYVKPFLERLKQEGIKMCVATATGGALANKALSRLEILPYFSFVLTCADVGKGKDDPAIYQQACERMGVLLKDAVLFEDALHCVKTAKKIGLFVVGVYDRSAKNEQEEMKKMSDRMIDSFAETEWLF